MKVYEQTLLLNRLDTTFKAQFCLMSGSLKTLIELKDQFLHRKERECFDALKFEKRQLSYLLGRYSAKKAISTYYGINEFYKILIDTGVFQQPIVQFFKDEKIQISLSHCDNIAVALVFPEAHPMGIDLEFINENNIDEIKSQMTYFEIQLINSNVLETAPATLYACFWAAKESLSKILRTGLMASFEIFEINKIRKQDFIFESEFKYFYQYKALSFVIENYIISIVCPKNTNIEFDT